VIRVVVTGSECTGKTTLAAALAERYDVPWVPELARRFVAQKGSAPDAGDVETIAHGQIEAEEQVGRTASGLLILDTDLLSTVVYSRHYYSACPPWIVAALDERAADLYLLAGIDVPWIPDGDQRDRGTRREEMQGLFRRQLVDRELTFTEIHGTLERRLAAAEGVIDRLLRTGDSARCRTVRTP